MFQHDNRGPLWPGLSHPFCWQTPGVCFHLVSCFGRTLQWLRSDLGISSSWQSCCSPDKPSCIFQLAPPVGDFWQKREGQKDNISLPSSVVLLLSHQALCLQKGVRKGTVMAWEGETPQFSHGSMCHTRSHPPCFSFLTCEVRDSFPRQGCHLRSG